MSRYTVECHPITLQDESHPITKLQYIISSAGYIRRARSVRVCTPCLIHIQLIEVRLLMACFGGGVVTGHCVSWHPMNIALIAAAMAAVRENSMLNSNFNPRVLQCSVCISASSLELSPGIWILGSGFWDLDSGIWILEPRLFSLDIRVTTAFTRLHGVSTLDLRGSSLGETPIATMIIWLQYWPTCHSVASVPGCLFEERAWDRG